MKQITTKLSLLIAVIYFDCSSQTKQFHDYPFAQKIDKVNIYHGSEVSDPYQWMEDLNSPELNEWMSAQDDFYESYLASSQSMIKQFKSEIAELSEKDVSSAPLQSGEKLILPVATAGSSSSSYYLIDRNTKERDLLIDLEKLNTETKTYSFNNLSPAGAYLCFSETVNKSRYANLYFLDINKKQTLRDTINGYYFGRSFMAWNQDASGFYYSKYEVPKDPQAPLPRARFLYHKMGTDQEDDRLIYENPDQPTWIYASSISYDDQWLIVSIVDPGELGNRIMVKDLRKPNSQFVTLVDNFENTFTFLYKNSDRLYFRTTLDAPNHRVVAINTNQLEEREWEEIIPESEEVISGTFVVGSRLVLRSNVVTRKVLNFYDLDGNFQFKLEPDGSNIFLSRAERHSTKAYLTSASIVSPVSVSEVDLQSGQTTLYSNVDLSINPDDYTFEHSSYASKDGTEIPIQLIYKKGLKKDGNTPVFLYAYGAFNWSAFLWQSYLRPWIQRGGIYAVPSVRGGGVYGAEWYKAGSNENKQNVIDDYISASEWLIEDGYTRKGLIVANGGSASGLLPAIATNIRPDLYGACIIDYPVLDMLRYDKFGSANWTGDFGSADNEEDFELLRSYSPYHNLVEGRCYPPTLVQVGELDNTTTPMHGYKYTAALQSAVPDDCSNPVVLKIARGAGHSAGATRLDRAQTQAEQIAFLFKVLELDDK